MRIIAGDLKGRSFNSPNSERTHPMSEKARGALFNALGDIEGLTVLDAFAGTGALSFEAISRGAHEVTAIEVDKTAHSQITKSIKELGMASHKIKAVRANASGWSDNNPDKTFDIVLLDPPFDKLQLKLLQKLVVHVNANGLFILNWPGKLKVPEFVGLKPIKTKEFGDTQLVFYRRIT